MTTGEWVVACVCDKCWCTREATEAAPVCSFCQLGSHLPSASGDPRPGAPAPRKCVRHSWAMAVLSGDLDAGITRCRRCHAVQNPAKVKAGRNNRARGNRHELHVARQYGGTKIGPLGGPADVVSDLFAAQVKTHSGPPPARVLRLLEAMDSGAGGRVPILIDRYLRPGRRPVDIVTLRGADWIALHGPTTAETLPDLERDPEESNV